MDDKTRAQDLREDESPYQKVMTQCSVYGREVAMSTDPSNISAVYAGKAAQVAVEMRDNKKVLHTV